MELIHSIHNYLGVIANTLKLVLEAISVFCVTMGLLATLTVAFRKFSYREDLLARAASVRLRFGTWLSLALEFQLGADIVATTVNPSLESLIELAVLAAIRTILNLFLQKELETEAHRQAAALKPGLDLDGSAAEKG